ncbi:MAG: hypothetical protein HP494_18425 [Nitrospira sp.]|nr:hypothetical protein [Nitrospira sp.]
MSRSLVILGSGYTARVALPLAERRYDRVLATSRNPDHHLASFSPNSRVQFDLSDRTTWQNIPPDGDLLWCFPAEPAELVQDFAEGLGVSSRRLVVLGSTSAYGAGDTETDPPPWTDEAAPVDRRKLRVQGEEYLREKHGAVLLRVAGIYGPGRNPLDWIKKGRVGLSRKYVNLIHVEDLAEICLTALERGVSGEVYNVSDGTPRTWMEICVTAQQRWGVTASATTDHQPIGKQISNAKLRTELGYVLKYPNLYESLALLKSVDEGEAQDGQNGFQQGPRREGTGGVPSGVR